MGTGGRDLVNEVLDRDDAELAKGLLDDLVGREGNALLVDLAVPTLVDELADGLEVGLTVGDVGLNAEEHLGGRLGDLDEDTVVDLEETEELQDLAGLGGNVVDTTGGRASVRIDEREEESRDAPLDPHDEVDLGLGGDVEVTVGLGLTTEADLLTLLLVVLVDVLLGTLEDDGALGLADL